MTSRSEIPLWAGQQGVEISTKMIPNTKPIYQKRFNYSKIDSQTGCHTVRPNNRQFQKIKF